MASRRALAAHRRDHACLQSKTRCSSPVAQRRFADRLRRGGGRAILDLRIRPGKRANCTLSIFEWYVHDPIRDDVVSLEDPLPEKPWLECLATVLPVKHRDKKFSAVLFLLSHHAMQRLAERCGARTPFGLLDVMLELWRAVEQAVDWDKAITRGLDGEQDIPIARPKFLPVAGGKAVFEWDARDKSRLVVTTILDGEMAA